MPRGLMEVMGEIEERRLAREWRRKEEEAYIGTAAWCREHGGIEATCVGDSHHRFIMPSGAERIATDRREFDDPKGGLHAKG